MVQRAELHDVIPVLPARNVSDAVDYYLARLGFELAFQVPDDDPNYAMVRRGGVRLHLQSHTDDEFQQGAGQLMLRLVVDDPDALFAEYQDKSVFHAGTALRNTPWNTREFAFWDLNHNGLTFMRDL